MKMEEKGSGSLLSQWKSRRQNEPSQSIEKVDEGKSLILSHGQQRLWMLQQLNPENPFYNYSEAYVFKGPLQVEKLYQALQKIYDSHDILRTTYSLEDDTPIAVIGPKDKLHVGEYDLSSEVRADNKDRINKILLTDAAGPFDLENGPVIRFSLYRLSQDRHILLLNLHHIATDKWSMDVFRRQLARYYRALCHSEELEILMPDVQYHDYASWQRKNEVDQEQIDFWLEKLSGEIPVLELPKDNPAPSVWSYRGSFNRQSHSKLISDDVLKLCTKLETTPYVLLLSVYYLLLFRYTGQKDILIGSPISNRNHKSLEDLIGFFNDTVVLRTIFKPEMSFVELVKEVRNTTLEAFANKEVAFEDLVKIIQPERSANTNPFFNVMFLYHSVPDIPDFGPEIEFSQDVFDTKVAKFDLTLYVSEDNGLLTSIFEYATDIFEDSTIERLQSHFGVLLKGVVSNPGEKISEIPMLSAFEKEFFLNKNQEFNDVVLPVSGIHELIEEVVLKFPNKTAVTFNENSITYKELDGRATALANKILDITNNENCTIGLCMDRSVEMVVGLLGILKAGCAYLPLDPDYPNDRIQYMLKDSETSLIIAHLPTLDAAKDFESEVLNISEIEHDSKTADVTLPKVKETDRAYIIYTSGSSGRPKGVPITHKNIITSTLGRTEFYKNDPTAFLLMSSISFDSSKAGIFWTLCTGGNLVISEKRLEQDIHRLSEVIEKNKVSHTLMLPSLYKMVIEHTDANNLRSLKTAIVAGEACSADLCSKHFELLPTTKLYNEYGPTEATVWCIAHKIEPEEIGASIPIGKPVSKAVIYLLNENLGIVPYGAVGEIYIGGPGLSGTYLNRQDLSEAAYFNNPFSDGFESKLYKTGDLGRYNSKGNIEFLGRADDQVKIRGFRIELEEIENTILKIEGVSEAVVLVEQVPSSSQKRLRAFLKTSSDLEVNDLKIKLRTSLPDYMVPSTFISLDEFPKLPNGKVDKKSLSKVKTPGTNKEIAENDLPSNDKEKKLKKIWEEVLNIPSIGINDNFFEIGGDSISSIQIVAKSRAAGIPLKPNQIFKNQTIGELAMFVDESRSETAVEENLEGEVLLTPIQHWFFETRKSAPNYWNQIVSVSGIGDFSVEILKDVLLNLVGYHDALRLSFCKKDNNWKAFVLKIDEIKVFHHFDISNLDNKAAQDDSIKQQMISIQRGLNLTEGGLFMGLYFDCGETQENKFLLIAHHLVIDMVSWNALFNDFQDGIEQLRKNEKIKFKQKTTSIRKWAEKLKALALSPELQEEEKYWRAQNIENTPLPTDFNVNNSTYPESSIVIYQSVLNAESTKILREEANEAYNTKIEDILISTLCKTITDWSKTDKLLLGLERHGRNTELGNFDISNTVGWFTSFFSITIENPDKKDLGKHLVATKEQLRTIPSDGIGYGILKYLSKASFFESKQTEPQIIFNYLGVQNKNSKTSEIVFEYLWEGARDSMSERTYGLEINTSIADGHLHMYWSYSSDLYKESTILRLVSDFNENLTSLLSHCCSIEEGNYTPSDFPEADLSQDDLDNLMKQFD